MKNSQAAVFGKMRRTVLLTACSLPFLIGSNALAQQATDNAGTSDQPVKLDKFVVTGSYIPAAADEANALPVQVVDSKMIDQTGITSSVLDVLRKAVPQIVGANNIGVENGNINSGQTNGGSSVALRNTTTLVLIDGQRVAFDPVAASGSNGSGLQFVDLNVVPVSAVERIEVLMDGASAIYGTDAVSGVINIILKKSFEGAEFGGYYGFTKSDKSGAMHRERSGHIVGGASNGKTSLTFSAEWTKNDPLFERDYNYTSPVFLTASYPGVINDRFGQFYRLNPTLNAPPATPTTIANLVAAGVYVPVSSNDIALGFDLSHRPTFLSSLTKEIASLAFEHKISDVLTLKATILYAKTSAFAQLNPQPIVFRVNTNAGNTGLPGIPFTDANTTVRNRFLFAGNREYPTDTNAKRGTIELDGKITSEWSWTAGAVYNTSDQTAIGRNQILNSALQTGIRTGLINLTAITQDPTLVAQADIFGSSIGVYNSSLLAYNLRATGKLFDLPGGPVSTAFGIDYRKETLSATADKNSIVNPITGTSAWNNGVTISPFDAGRNNTGEFLEVKVPVASADNHIAGLHSLAFDGAIRHEKYSDTGTATVPKVSMWWLPFDDQLAIRSTYSKSYAVPSLFNLFGPTSQGATPTLAGIVSYDTTGNPIGVFPNLQGTQQNGSNPLLKPSHSSNYTVGFVYSPRKLKGFSLSVDYYHIKEIDIPGGLASTVTIVQDVEHFGPASIYAPYVHLGNFGQLGGTNVTTPGQLHTNPTDVFVDQFLANVAVRIQNGLDITLKYDFQTSVGTFNVTSSWVYLHSFRQQPAVGQPFQEFVGNDGFGTLPKFSEYTTVTWAKGPYSASLANRYVDKVVQFADLTTPIPSYTQFDLQGSVDVGKVWHAVNGLHVTVGINNIFNKYPPTDPNDFSDPPADTGTYGSIGRFYFGEFTYKF
jgi:iron complex outermembrane receptor protein